MPLPSRSDVSRNGMPIDLDWLGANTKPSTSVVVSDNVLLVADVTEKGCPCACKLFHLAGSKSTPMPVRAILYDTSVIGVLGEVLTSDAAPPGSCLRTI